MDILKDINDQSKETREAEEEVKTLEEAGVVSLEEEEIEKEIGNVLRYSGYDEGSEEWKSAMFRWKRRRTTKPRMYRKFVDLD